MGDISKEINGREMAEKPRTRHKGKHDKDKPWDDPSIDHWKVEKFDPSWNESGLLEVSSFSTLFPQYRGPNTLPYSFYRLQAFSFFMQVWG